MDKSKRININKILKKNILIIILMISMCPILSLSYARFVINTDSYRSSEMYIAELLYSVKIDNENKYTLEVPSGESEYVIEISSLNLIASNYKLAYKNNSNIKVEYASDYIDPSYGGIVTTRTIMIRVTNSSTSKQTLSLSVFGGYSFNSVEDVIVPTGYTEIKNDYWKYDYETLAIYVDNTRVEELDDNTNYTLSSYTCTNNETVKYDSNTKTISITPAKKQTKCSLYFKAFYPSLKDKILTDNTVYRDDIKSTYVSSASGIDFADISSPTNGQGLYTNNKLEDGDNYYFRGGSFCSYEGYLSEDSSGTKCKAAGGTWSNYKCSYDLSKTACTGHGTWYELKNNVSFGGYMWKIIRIDENGEVRLLYNGNSTTSLGTASRIRASAYNASSDDNAYEGYMRPNFTGNTTSKEEAEANEIDSAVKELNDKWYNDNLLSVSEKISKEAGYCNDRSIYSGDGYGKSATYYSSYNRVYTKHTPSYKCPNESNDLFTMSESSKGNRKLTYPVGLITLDEVAYAGSIYSKDNYLVFTHSGTFYWTMSPAYFSGGLSRVSYLNGLGNFGYYLVTSNGAVRPVVSLTSEAVVTGGDGSIGSPYIVE